MDIVFKIIPRLAYNAELRSLFMTRLGFSFNSEEYKIFGDELQELSKLIKVKRTIKSAFNSINSEISCWDEMRDMFMSPTQDQVNLLYEINYTDSKEYFYYTKECNEPMDVANFLHANIYWGDIFRCGELIYMRNGSSLFEEGKKKIVDKLSQFILNNKFFILTPKEEEDTFTVKKINRYKDAEEVIKMFLLNVPEEEELREIIDKESIGRLFFKKGYYDFERKQFYENGSMTLMKIPRNFSLKGNTDLRQKIQEKIFTPIFNNPTTQAWFLYKIARAVAGKRVDKHIIMVVGKRDSGKGCLSLLLENTFKKYITTLDLGVFAEKKNRGDVARENSFACCLESARIAIMNESTNCILDGNKLKQIFSGGDTIKVRRLYQEDTEQKVQATPFLFCNEPPKFNCDDVNEKIYELRLTSKFVPEDYPESKKLTNIAYFPMDDDVKDKFIYDPAVLNEFMLMVIEAYHKPVPTPACVIKEKEETRDDIDRLRDAFKPDPNGFMSNKQIKQTCIEFEIRKGLKEVKKDIQGLGYDDVVEHRTGQSRGLKGIKAGMNEM